MIEEILGDYRFIKNTKSFKIESPRCLILQAELDEDCCTNGFMWRMCSGELFPTFAELWEHISDWLNDVRTVLWPQERCDDYFLFIDSLFRGNRGVL